MNTKLAPYSLEANSTDLDLPLGWALAALPAVADINMGQSPPGHTYNTDGKGLPFFQGKAEFGDRYPLARKWCTAPGKEAHEGDVLISVRAPVGPTNIANCHCAIGRGLAAIRPMGGIPSEWMLHAIRLQEKQIAAMGVGSTFTAISKPDLQNVTIPIAPLSEQRRILELLERLLVKLASCEQRLQRASEIIDRLRQAVLDAAVLGKLTGDWRAVTRVEESGQELLKRVSNERAGSKSRGRHDRSGSAGYEPDDLDDLPDLPDLPEGWGLARVGFVVELMQYGTSTKADASAENGVAVLRMGNIQDGRLDLSELKFIDPKKEDLAPYVLKRGDLVFNRTNSPELVGKCAVFRTGGEYVFASYLIRIRCDRALMSSDFLSAWITSPWGRAWARRVRTDGVSQSNINTVKLGAMPVPVPPLEEQREIIKMLRVLQESADSIEDRVRSAEANSAALGDAILAKAFGGELVPTEVELARNEGRSFESAAELLERIRQERAESSNGHVKKHARRGIVAARNGARRKKVSGQ